MNIDRHIEAARMIVANRNEFPASLVELCERVLRQHFKGAEND